MTDSKHRMPGLRAAGLLASFSACCLFALGFAPLASAANTTSTTSGQSAEAAHGPPSDFILNENDGDPLGQFNRWRQVNRISLPVTPAVLRAHQQWGSAKGGGTCHGPNCGGGGGGGGGTTAADAPSTGVLNNADIGSNLPAYQGETTIAVDPTNANHLVGGANTFYADPTPACNASSGSTYGTQAIYESNDNGSSWSYACAPWAPSLTGGAGPTYFGSDPAVAFSSDGTAYMAYMLLSQSRSGRTVTSAIVVAKKGPTDTSWQVWGVVSNHFNNSSLFDDKEMIAVDNSGGVNNGRVYVIWDINNVETVAYSDTGASWHQTTVETSGDYNIGGDLAVGTDGTVYATWNRLLYSGNSESGETTVFSKSTDGGNTWSTPTTVASHALLSFGSNNTPPAQDQRGVNAFASLDYDAFSGNLYVVYADFPSGTSSGTDLNVYLQKSTDGGATWSGRVKVNQDTTQATQFFPWVSSDPADGTVVVSWYDTRSDANYKQTHDYMAFSRDGGSTFTERTVSVPSSQFANSTVSYSDESSTDNPNYNANQYGDYAQIAISGGYAHTIWTDSRAFYPGNTASGVKEEAASATINLNGQ